MLAPPFDRLQKIRGSFLAKSGQCRDSAVLCAGLKFSNCFDSQLLVKSFYFFAAQTLKFEQFKNRLRKLGLKFFKIFESFSCDVF